MTTSKGDLYPNMYVLIVGPAGSGKSLAVNTARRLLYSMEKTGVRLAPTSVTMASMVDELLEAKRTIVRPAKIPPIVEYNSLNIFISEFSAFMHKYDGELMAGLTDMWDGWGYSQRRRGNNLKINIERACLNILAGSTSAHLVNMMPEIAWTQGFASRLLMVYSGDQQKVTDIFDVVEGSTDETLFQSMSHDLHMMQDIYGRLTITPEAAAEFHNWRLSGMEPTPQHPKLVDYCARRTAHLIKLCMIASVDRGSDLKITLEDYERAKQWLLGAESTMSDVFTSATGGGDSKAMDEAWYFVHRAYAKRKKPVPEHELVHFVRERVPSHAVMKTIEIMVLDGSLKKNFDVRAGIHMFEPGPKAIEI